MARLKTVFGIAIAIAGIFQDARSDTAQEILTLRETFATQVGNDTAMETPYHDKIFNDAFKKLSEAGVTESQYFLYVDRNPALQLIFVCFFDSECGKIIEIGNGKTSTGNPRRKGYFLTPTGVFANTTDNPSYRALGTKNDKGWRGMGKKGARVWDFGWRKTTGNVRGKMQPYTIRLLLHATDPTFGEPRLGRPDSKGCVRISGKLNDFLDCFSIPDKKYEENNHHILRKNRTPVTYQGEYLIISDSSEWED